MAASLAKGIGRKAVMVLGALAGALVVSWLLFCAIVFSQQGRLIFPAPPGSGRVPVTGRLLRLPSSAGEVVAAHFQGPPGAPTAVFFHGNGEELADGEQWAEQLQRAGLGVLLVEYPGYGLSKALGPPSEEKCYQAGEVALAHLRQNLGVPVQRTVLVGFSLGSAVASELALRGHAARLVLLAPISAVADRGRSLFWFLPVDLLVRHRFETLKKAPRISVPALVVHGTRDEVAPAWMGERIAQALPAAQLVLVEGGTHDLLSPRLQPLAACVAAFAQGRGGCELPQ